MDGFKYAKKDDVENLPKTAGVYAFFGKNLKPGTKHPTPIYIGKAINIKNRVKNHFYPVKYREAVISPKAKLFDRVNQPSLSKDGILYNLTTHIGFLETNSEIEALILEANLIKKYQPAYNVAWRDDKNYFYVAIAENEDRMPFVFITHQIKQKLQRPRGCLDYKLQTQYIGPFVEGTALKKTLRFLRKAFPYYTSRKHPKNKCTYCHLELCPGPLLFENPPSDPRGAPASARLREYKKNIKKLILILKGKRSAVLKALKREMKLFARENKFEEAGAIRDKIYSLQQVMAHTQVINNQSPATSSANDLLAKIIGAKSVNRIECYDVSNIQGKQATGSMVVFINGKPDKSRYKKFRIKTGNEPNDIAMLKEILSRRLVHTDWIYPEVILIDGGVAQMNIAIKVRDQFIKNVYLVKSADKIDGVSPETKQFNRVKVLALAKKNNELFIEGRKNPILLKSLPQEVCNLILQLDDEAHRFAIDYHKKLREKHLLR